MSEIPTSIHTLISALVGSGSGLITAAVRGAQRFTALENKVDELEGEQTTTKGRISSLEFHIDIWKKLQATVEGLPRYMDSLKGSLSAIQQNVGDIYTRLESLRKNVEELDRKSVSNRDLIQQKIGDLRDRIKEEQQRIKDLQAGFRLELASIKSSVEEDLHRHVTAASRSSNPFELASTEELRRRVSAIEATVDKLRDEDKQFVRLVAFTSYVEEQGRQWNEIQRTLGRLEGMLKSPGSSPGMRAPLLPPRGSSNSTR